MLSTTQKLAPASVALAFLVSGCFSGQLGTSRSDDSPITEAAAARDDESEDEEEDDPYAAEDAAFDLAQAKSRLVIAELEAKRDVESAEREVADTVEELARVELAIATFDLERSNELGDSELGLKRSRDRVLEAEQELTELQAMYDADEFAATTEELVLDRGRRQLENARRSLELQEQAMKILTEHEHVARARELEIEKSAAEFELAQANTSLEIAKLEASVGLADARWEVTDAEREVADL